MKRMKTKTKSVQSIHPCKSPDYHGAGVIQTIKDIVKAQGGQLPIENSVMRVPHLLFRKKN